MPDSEAALGASYTAYVPDDDEQIGLGYTAVRIYWGATRSGAYTLKSTITLVAGQKDYNYNNTAGLATDWAYHTLYGAGPGESPGAEPIPVGPPVTTRLAMRQGVGTRLNIMELLTATGTAATKFTAPELIDPDRSAHSVGNRFVRAATGTYAAAIRRVRTGSTGYSDQSTGEVTFNRTFGGTLAASTQVELWTPRGDTDPSARIDEASNRARLQLWWRDTWFLSTDDAVTEYYLPPFIAKAGVHSIDYAADTYPTRPGWRPVGWWDIASGQQTPLLTVLTSADGNSPYPAGTVIRIDFNRYSDRLDADTDSAGVALEWAVAEVAYEYLLGATTGNKEADTDLLERAKLLEREAVGMRGIYMPPAPNPRERLPR